MCWKCFNILSDHKKKETKVLSKEKSLTFLYFLYCWHVTIEDQAFSVSQDVILRAIHDFSVVLKNEHHTLMKTFLEHQTYSYQWLEDLGKEFRVIEN